jgi:hypothetical protein
MLQTAPRRRGAECIPRAFALLLSCVALTHAQSTATRQASEITVPAIEITVVDETGVAVPGANVVVTQPGQPLIELRTGFAGQCSFTLISAAPYAIKAEKAGFYQFTETVLDPHATSVKVVLAHEQIVREQVNVSASTPGIDTAQPADILTMNTPEIVNIPYVTSRDIRNLLPFYPGVVQDSSGQAHVAGAETWETLDTLDGFDIRSPEEGTLDMRVSADAVRSIDAESTRYPVEFGRATGGVFAFYTGMGDNRFRFNATNFIPSFRDLNGIRFDKFVPRFTLSGPLARNRAWFYDGLETEYDNIYISELPANADSDWLIRGSNVFKIQANASPKNIVTAAVLFNDYHSPYDGISSLTPQQSTTKRDTIAWLPYVRDQFAIRGALIDLGVGVMRFRDGFEPHGDEPYQITPELAQGSYFQNLTGRSQRVEATAALYLPVHEWLGTHQVKAGLDLDRIGYNQYVARTPVSYLRQDGTLDRQSVFAPAAPFTLHNADFGAYLEDHWQIEKPLLVEPGLRLDWDEIVRKPLWAPRIAAVFSPGAGNATKVSAGVGLYYEHTDLSYPAQTFAGVRSDTYFEADGVTPSGPAEESTFTMTRGSLEAPRALNWSVGVEQKLPWRLIAGANFIDKHTSRLFSFSNQSGSPNLAGDYLLTNQRQDRYYSFEVDARRLFANNYTIFASYTRSSARTNAMIDFLPTPSPLGPQQSGPLAWDTPSRFISWGWLPVAILRLEKNWDFVYSFEIRTGFPYTSINAADQVAGAAGSRRFPEYVNFSPGLEWKFHFRGAYFGLRGVMENGTGAANASVVNNNVDSPMYGAFSEPEGRAFTARLRLIGSK